MRLVEVRLDIPPVPGLRMVRQGQDGDWSPSPAIGGHEGWFSYVERGRLLPAGLQECPGTVVEVGTLFVERFVAVPYPAIHQRGHFAPADNTPEAIEAAQARIDAWAYNPGLPHIYPICGWQDRTGKVLGWAHVAPIWKDAWIVSGPLVDHMVGVA